MTIKQYNNNNIYNNNKLHFILLILRYDDIGSLIIILSMRLLSSFSEIN